MRSAQPAATLTALFVLVAASMADAATHSVPASVTTVGPSYDGGVAPGDVLVLASGTRGRLVLEELAGQAASPIVVRIASGATEPTTIDGAGGTWGLEVDHCEHVVIDGTATGGLYYGIVVTSSVDGHHTYVKLRNRSRFITLRRVEVAGTSAGAPGIGISFNDHTILRADYPGFWVEGHRVLDCYVHDTTTEGMYLGPNNETDEEPYLRDIEIAYNRVENTGWDCINPKSWVDGDNAIHHNRLRHCGYLGSTDGEQASGIALKAFHGEVYNNWIEDTAGRGIVSYGLGAIGYDNPNWNARIYNNVLVDIGGFAAFEGIKVFTPVEIFNNSIIRPTAEAVYGASAASGLVHDNIFAAAPGDAVRLGGLNERDNWEGSVAEAGFVDPSAMDFHLTETSPARNAVTEAGFASFDYDDVPRPQESAADYGAYEYLGEAGAAGGTAGAGGAGGGSAGAAAGGGGAAAGGPGSEPATAGEDGGCGCRLATRPGSAHPWLGLGLLGALALLRQRRRRSGSGHAGSA